MYDVEKWTVRDKELKYLESFVVRLWKKLVTINWQERVTNAERFFKKNNPI